MAIPAEDVMIMPFGRPNASANPAVTQPYNFWDAVCGNKDNDGRWLMRAHATGAFGFAGFCGPTNKASETTNVQYEDAEGNPADWRFNDATNALNIELGFGETKEIYDISQLNGLLNDKNARQGKNAALHLAACFRLSEGHATRVLFCAAAGDRAPRLRLRIDRRMAYIGPILRELQINQ